MVEEGAGVEVEWESVAGVAGVAGEVAAVGGVLSCMLGRWLVNQLTSGTGDNSQSCKASDARLLLGAVRDRCSLSSVVKAAERRRAETK